VAYSEQLIKRVAEIGVLACELGRLDDAEAIFGGVAAVADDAAAHTAAGLGMAATKIASGNFDEGVKLLSEALPMEESDQNMDALALQVYAMKKAGRDKEADVLIPKLTAIPGYEGSLAEEILKSLEV